MFYTPYCMPLYPMARVPEDVSYVRLLHAVPDAPAVDVYANGNIMVSALSYRDFTEYLQVPAGSYNIRVFPAGQTQNPVVDTNLTIPPRSIYTVAASGRLANIGLLPVNDPRMPIPAGKVYVRFVHLSPNAPEVDVTLPGGAKLFGNVGFREVTSYVPVDPGTYTFNVRISDTGTPVLYVPNITLKGNRFYTIYAVGLAGATPSLQVLVPLDGNSYIKF